MFTIVIVLCVSLLHICYGLHDRKDMDRWNTEFTQYKVKEGRGEKDGFRNMARNGRVMVSERQEDYVTQDELDAAIAKVDAEINQVVAQMNAMNTQIQNSLTDINGQVDSLNSDMATVKSQQADERKPPPMFFGQLSDSAYYDKGEVYKFSSVQINQGSYYNTGDGKFTCGPTGWYFFTFSLYGYKLTHDGDHDLYGKLLKDGTEITVAYASNYVDASSSQWMNLQASTSVLIKCNEGQKVYLVGSNWGGSSAKTSSGDFVAMLVHKEE